MSENRGVEPQTEPQVLNPLAADFNVNGIEQLSGAWDAPLQGASNDVIDNLVSGYLMYYLTCIWPLTCAVA